jgi:hypothetical protein
MVSLFVTGSMAVRSLDIRSVIIFTSIANNVWLFSSLLVRFSVFLLFISIYFSLLLILLSPVSLLKNISLISLSGLPPFPIFFIKLIVVYGISSFLFFSDHYLLTVFLMLGTLLVSLSYIRLVVSDVITIPL